MRVFQYVYPEHHKCYNNITTKKLVCFKDKFRKSEKKIFLKKAKGITKINVKNHITFNNYKNSLFENIDVRRNMKILR